MLRHLTAAAALAALFVTGAAKADTITYSAPGGTSAYTVLGNESATITDTILGGSNTRTVGSGAIQLHVTAQNPTPASIPPYNLIAWCVDIKATLQGGSGGSVTYTTSSATNPIVNTPASINIAQANEIAALIQSYNNRGGINASAVQLAIWAIVYGASNGSFSVSGSTLTSGGFQVQGAEAALAGTYLTNVTNGTWTATAGQLAFLYDASNSDPLTHNQTLVTLGLSGTFSSGFDSIGVSEPASMAVLSFALLGLATVRRRRFVPLAA